MMILFAGNGAGHEFNALQHEVRGNRLAILKHLIYRNQKLRLYRSPESRTAGPPPPQTGQGVQGSVQGQPSLLYGFLKEIKGKPPLEPV